MVLLILAGGWGKRYGRSTDETARSQKQLAAIDAEGHTLMDYALYDAYRCGVRKAVIVTAPECKSALTSALFAAGTKMELIFAEQTPPEEFGFESTHPPLGTGHAFLCGAQTIKEPFVVLNADDYYGREAIEQAVQCAEAGKFGCVSYPAGQTVFRAPVHRGICLTEDNYLTGICECTFARDEVGKLYAEDTSCRRYVRESTPVNMNLYAMQPAITTTAAKCFATFLQDGDQTECYLGDIVTNFIARTHNEVCHIRAKSHWYGITYREDLHRVTRHIEKMQRKGVYPIDLWE